MSAFAEINRQHFVIMVLGLGLSLLLVAVPPVEIGGVAIWLYLTPALLAAYCIPLPLVVMGCLVGSVVSYFYFRQVSGGELIAEAIASGVFLLGIASGRRWAQRTDTLLIGSNLLLFVALPLNVALNAYLGERSFEFAMLSGSRYALSSLVGLLLAEMISVGVSLSRSPSLALARTFLGARPSMVHVSELVIGAAVAFSFFVTLGAFWRYWDTSLEEGLRDSADLRFNTFFATAESSTREHFQAAAKEGATLGIHGRYQPEELLLHVMAQLETGSRAQTRSLDGAGLALAYDGLDVLLTPNVEATTSERAFALARAQVTSGLVAIDLRMPNGALQPAHIYIAPPGLPDILLIYADELAAADYSYAVAREVYASLYTDELTVLNTDVDTSRLLGLPGEGNLIEVNDRGWALWAPDTARMETAGGRAMLTSADEKTLVTFSPDDWSLERFSRALHGVSRLRLTMNYWDFFATYARAVILSTALGITLLTVLLWLARLLVGSLVRPLSELTAVFESWRQFRGGELGSGAALQAMDARGFSSLEDIHSLQVGFRSLAQDVMYGERRLSTIAANYDELLRSLPLGVLAVDGASRVQFLNDALGEITEQRQEAIARLKAQAAQMLATNTTVDEWQLALEDRPPKSLLLVVNHRLDDRGQESGLWVIATDLTEQKQTNAQLIQASKLATLGEMSTGMAHELNQPLNVISLATSNLRFSIKKGKATSDNTLAKLDRIDGAVHRAASIIDHMRAYGRLAGEGLSEINVGDVVKGSCNLLSEQLKLANITLVNEVPEEGLMVKGNAIQLEQVLINLINNAKDAIREQSQPGEITVDSEVLAGRVLLRVTDNGGGIPDHVLPHIFEPFFTTKPVGKGTGLGGSISYGIVREMQGDIWVENVPGGAQITISLPLMKA